MTHYETLGTAQSAGADEIKRAYRKLASQHHPDKGGDVKKFQEIEEAYRVLSDPQQRQQYDMSLQGGIPGGMQFHWNGHSGNIDDIFKQFGFGGSPFSGMRHPRRNKDLRIEIPIPLVSTLQEQHKTISVATTNGERTTVEVTIPRGVTNGTSIRYSGLGDNLFNTLPRGDLYVQFNVHAAENFSVATVDLLTTTSVNCLKAIAGGTIIVVGLDSRQFELTIPPGTQSGTRFRIPNQGLYQMNSDIRGSLYVEVKLEVPQNLTAEQVEIVKSLINH
jgi:curved DNA-binding protein